LSSFFFHFLSAESSFSSAQRVIGRIKVHCFPNRSK
jgi:hypothetical protein